MAVSLPADLYRALEKIRKQRRAGRSEVVQEAVQLWIDRQRELGLIGQYEAGYRRRPESAAEIRAAETAAVRLLAAEEW
jgi:metal-responsive CopG/Arc/MetJ family transcriptional regulator